MAQLAIKGHATRGNEVIEILEMAGGNNVANFIGDSTITDSYYTIEEDGYIYLRLCNINEDYIKFTLEEFLEKYPYKVGDKVHNIVHNENQTITNLVWGFQENEIYYQTTMNMYM